MGTFGSGLLRTTPNPHPVVRLWRFQPPVGGLDARDAGLCWGMHHGRVHSSIGGWVWKLCGNLLPAV